jgi:hypothetical protein
MRIAKRARASFVRGALLLVAATSLVVPALANETQTYSYDASPLGSGAASTGSVVSAAAATKRNALNMVLLFHALETRKMRGGYVCLGSKADIRVARRASQRPKTLRNRAFEFGRRDLGRESAESPARQSLRAWIGRLKGAELRPSLANSYRDLSHEVWVEERP